MRAFILINIYGPTTRGEKKEVWSQISTFLSSLNNDMVILGGDFNAIRNPLENNGGAGGFNIVHLALQNFITHNNLIDPKFKNKTFTWTNTQCGNKCISQKLDRFFSFSKFEYPMNLMGSLHPSLHKVGSLSYIS